MPKWPINGSLGLIEVKSSKSLFVWHWFRNKQAAISISTGCTPTKHQSAHRSKAAAKWSRPKFGPWTRKTRVGCYGLSTDFTAFSQALSKLATKAKRPIPAYFSGPLMTAMQRMRSYTPELQTSFRTPANYRSRKVILLWISMALCY